jgi:mono/diheme cytochrome c family protein
MSLVWMLALLFAASPPPWEKSKLVEGRDLYRENCAVCHDIDIDKMHSRKLGPSLNHLFKNEKLPLRHGKPSGQPVVQYGRFVMNTAAEIQRALRDYQRTCFG